MSLDYKNWDELIIHKPTLHSNNNITTVHTQGAWKDIKKTSLSDQEKGSPQVISKKEENTTLDIDKLVKDLGYRPEVGLAIKQASKEWGVPEYAIFILCMNENCSNYWEAIGDNGCSFGAFQMNECAGNGSRKYQKHRDKIWKECAFDIYCSTDWVASQIKTTYKCKIEWNSITNPDCLAKHQWAYPDSWYLAKTRKNLWFISKYM